MITKGQKKKELLNIAGLVNTPDSFPSSRRRLAATQPVSISGNAVLFLNNFIQFIIILNIILFYLYKFYQIL